MDQLDAALQSFKASSVLLIGDVILDEYRYGNALGISSETPTIVVRDGTTDFSIGGAGLLCRNMLALGGKVTYVTLLGDDEFRQHADDYNHERLRKQFYEEAGRKTTVKSRFYGDGYKLLQWDRLDNRNIGTDVERRIEGFIDAELGAVDKLIVSDYRHGLISEQLAQWMVKTCKEKGKPIYIDSQVSQRGGNHRWYTGADLFCLNLKEALTIDGDFEARSPDVSLPLLQRELQCESVIVKLGEKGCVALFSDQFLCAAPPPTTVLDTTGAGDAFFSVVALSPAPLTEAALRLANVWASLSTTLKGAQPPTIDMLESALRSGQNKP